MRRFFTMKSPPIIATYDPAVKAATGAQSTTAGAATAARAQRRSHSHDHGHSHGGHGHAHSHGSIEKNISGKYLRQCQVATLAGGATNVFFCVTKLWIGSAGGSVALVADGFHALTDILADIISYGAISLSQKKFPRCRFPFGIGRLETSGAVLVAAILFFGGVALLVQSLEQCVLDVANLFALPTPTGGIAAAVMMSVRNAMAAAAGTATGNVSDGDAHGHSHAASSSSGGSGDTPSTAVVVPVHTDGNDSHSHNRSHGDGHHGHSHFEVTQYDATTGKQVILWTMVAIATASVVTKEILFRWTRRVGLRAGSRVVVANAYHHRADAWSGGVALIGVAGQVVGIPGIDGLAGLAVSLSICQIGYGLFRDAVLEFFDYQNAEEVSAIREQLQDFSLRIEHGRPVVTPVPEADSAAATAAAAAAAVVSATHTSSFSSSASATEDATAVQRKKILFMNVFLVRHGHQYSLHVTLLVHESVSATQIREATDLLTALARGSLPVQDTFTTLLVCSNHTETREEYLGSEEEETGAPEEEKEAAEAAAKTKAAAPRHAEEKSEGKHELHTAATGNIINPSLEQCIASLGEFHAFTSPIFYNWEDRTITAPSSGSCECERDIASVADMFRCELISDGGSNSNSNSSSSAVEAKESCHGHSHDSHSH